MKKIATVASATALGVASLSAGAWWTAPYAPYGLSAEQQKAMMEQQSKAMEQMMAAQRKMAEQMAAQQQEMAKRMKEQGFGPGTMDYPMDAFGADPFGGAPFGADPFGSGPFGADPFSGQVYGSGNTGTVKEIDTSVSVF